MNKGLLAVAIVLAILFVAAAGTIVVLEVRRGGNANDFLPIGGNVNDQTDADVTDPLTEDPGESMTEEVIPVETIGSDQDNDWDLPEF